MFCKGFQIWAVPRWLLIIIIWSPLVGYQTMWQFNRERPVSCSGAQNWMGKLMWEGRRWSECFITGTLKVRQYLNHANTIRWHGSLLYRVWSLVSCIFPNCSSLLYSLQRSWIAVLHFLQTVSAIASGKMFLSQSGVSCSSHCSCCM